MALTILGLSVNDILSVKKRGIGADGYVSDLYSAAAGEAGLVDTANTTAIYDPTDDVYGEGVVQTNKLYHSATAITTLKVNDLRMGSVATGATVDISFDDGSSWSTATNQLNTDVTSFTGTSDDGGTYKLKLKFTLGATYLESGAYVWVTTGSLNASKTYLAGCGTTAAALSFGGEYVDTTEIWNGSAWATTSETLSEVKIQLAACGTTAAALAFGGNTGGGVALTTTEKWLVSSWATTTVLLNAKRILTGCGTTAGALSIAGHTGAGTDITEKWNGSVWATTTSTVYSRFQLAGCGTTSDALAFGGYIAANTAATERWLNSGLQKGFAVKIN